MKHHNDNVKWLSQGTVLKRFFNLINKIWFFMTQKYKILPELDDDIHYRQKVLEHYKISN